jgi:DNA-binding response OmpR family regulator
MTEDTIRILLVEDDASVRDAVAGFLRDEGYGVETASDGQEAKEKM